MAVPNFGGFRLAGFTQFCCPTCSVCLQCVSVLLSLQGVRLPDTDAECHMWMQSVPSELPDEGTARRRTLAVVVSLPLVEGPT